MRNSHSLKLRSRIEELEEENRQLREALLGDDLPSEAGLTVTETIMVRILRAGRLLTIDAVNAARGVRSEPMSEDTLKVHICKIRRKTDLPITTAWGKQAYFSPEHYIGIDTAIG